MSSLRLDMSKTGLNIAFKDYQVEALKLVYGSEEGQGSGKLWERINDNGVKISRASVINFSNDMVDLKVFDFVEKTGKGGHHRIYHPGYNSLSEAIEAVRGGIIEKLENDATYTIVIM